MPVVTLPDGSTREFDQAVSVYDVAADIGPGLAKAALAGKVDGELVDTSYHIEQDTALAIITGRDEEALELMRHDAAHVMAQAVQELYPGTQVTIGPAIENGFYYDFAREEAFTPEDLKKIEQRMHEIVKRDLPIVREVWDRDEARKAFGDIGEKYKVEIIEDIIPEGEEVSVYRQGDGFDVCRGPHLPSTGKLGKGFKLMKLAGAYWRGDERNPQLQRIYGTAWEKPQELKDHLRMLEEAKKRDHRKLGKELDIFVFDDEVGPGLPLWLPNGGILIEELEKLAKEIEHNHNYERVRTPHITKEALFLRSRHLPYYADSMYPPMEMEGVRYYIKPMNCPMHHKIFNARMRSYRDLPMRLGEYGTCYRYEKSGELFGLMRVRSMQMNDAHIYCSEAQLEEEFMDVISMYLEYFEIFNIEKYVMRLSTHHKKGLGKKYVDNEPLWLKTEEMVRRAMTLGLI